MTQHEPLADLVLDRHVFQIDARRMVIALVFPGEVVGIGVYLDGELVWMADRPAGVA